MSKNTDTTPQIFVAQRGARLAAERSPSVARADGARRSQPRGRGLGRRNIKNKKLIKFVFYLFCYIIFLKMDVYGN